MSFVKVCLEEIADNIEEKIRYNSLSSRLSKLEANDFEKFMKDIEPKTKTPPKIEVDHLAQMKQSKG